MGADAGGVPRLERSRLAQGRRSGPERQEPRQPVLPDGGRDHDRAALPTGRRPPTAWSVGTLAGDGPARPSGRARSQRPGARRSRRRRGRADRRFRGRDWGPRLRTEDVRSRDPAHGLRRRALRRRTAFRARPRDGRPARGAELRRAGRAIGRPPARLRRVLRARSLRRRRGRAFPGRLGVAGEALSRRRACRSASGATPDPTSSRTRRSVHAAGGTPGQELAFALSAGVALLRALESVAFRSTRRAA